MNTPKNDKMPSRLSPRFKAYERRLLKLSTEDFFRLFGVVGIVFPSRRDRTKIATLEELKEEREDMKDMYVEIFDEANSRTKIDNYLQERGL